MNIWQSYKQERDCLVHFLRHLALCWPGTQSVRQPRCLPNIHRLKKFTRRLSPLFFGPPCIVLVSVSRSYVSVMLEVVAAAAADEARVNHVSLGRPLHTHTHTHAGLTALSPGLPG